MTVKELIKILENFSPNATVFSTEEGNDYPIEQKDVSELTVEEMLQECDFDDIDEDYQNGAVYIG